MGNEIAVREVYQADPTGGRLVAWAQAASAANQLAISLCQTDFVPKRKVSGQEVPLSVGDATAMIIMGDELGFTPLAALRSIYIIHGTPALYSRAMIALILSRGHEIWTESSTVDRVEVHGKRKGSDHVEKSVWTTARAQKAGYTKNAKYQTNPEEMLFSKASAEIARKIGADVLLGIAYSVEELELEEPGNVVSIDRGKKSDGKPVSIARASAAQNANEVEEPEFDDEPDKTSDTPAVETGDSIDPLTESLDNPEDTEPISAAQIKTIGAAMTRLGMTDRAIAIAYVGDVVSRPIASRKDLTKDEASKVIRSLLADEGALKDSADKKYQEELATEAEGDEG